MRRVNRRTALQAMAAGALMLSAMASPSLASAQPAKNIVQIASETPGFSTLVAAIQAAGLVDALSAPGRLTVFAPTDNAFAKLPPGTIENLLKPENKQALTDILTYHVVRGKLESKTVVNLKTARTLNGASISIKVEDGKVFINNAQVTVVDVMASNGVIHVIDTVLIPPAKPKNIIDTAVGAGNFKTLVAAIQAAGLTETLKKGNYAVFAPTDEAFAKLPAGTVENLLKPENKQTLTNILLYHVVQGRLSAKTLGRHNTVRTLSGGRVWIRPSEAGLKVDGANVIAADVAATNGVIHAIDTVLIPPKDIVTTAIEAGNFTTLVAALQAAGLAETLKHGRFTVFAPTDQAFAKLPAGTVENLLKPENRAQLRSILLYHVVRGSLDSGAVLKHGDLHTLQGGRLTVTVSNTVKINQAQVILADVIASNGVIHVIDAVLLPPGR
ncbi:MAG: fasciclin domain-containing protein [Anaerolineae bacterium]|nr:fasciclin domain-containing protein [Thermoflexales bacterium]MDW8408305.1 fasciclin domain-containing protein [Anaerolineae bacterium]